MQLADMLVPETRSLQVQLLSWVLYRDVVQMVARVIWDHEVVGSSPVIPTRQWRNWQTRQFQKLYKLRVQVPSGELKGEMIMKRIRIPFRNI